MTVNYDRVCRLCLSSRGELLPIFPTTSSDDLEPPVLASRIKDCVSVQINENDDLPTNVCRKCMDNVNNWHLFKTVCVKTQNKLQSLLKDGSLLEEVQVKSEPLFEEAYDGVVIDGSYPEAENAGSSNKLQPEGPPILASLGLTPRSDKKYVDPRMDWHRVHAILDMVQETDAIDSLQSFEESDISHCSDHESETETELLPEIDDTYVDCKKGYICKNKTILLKYSQTTKAINAPKLKKRKVNVHNHCGHPKNAWQLLFSDDLLYIIVSSTNENIIRRGKGFSGCTNVGEVKTLIGILYLNGIMRPTHQKCDDLWHPDCGVPAIMNVMTNERFNFLIQNICFFSMEDDDTIMQLDSMKRIRKVFEIFAMNCRTTFDVESSAVVDEIIVPVYGPCPFRYDIDKKPLKRGIKVVLLVDPTNFYVSNLDVITDPYFGAEEIVKKITQHLYGTGKTIIMDSWYFSTHLMDTLKSYQLYTIAALHPKSDQIPPLFISEYRKNRRNMSGFFGDVLLTTNANSESKATTVATNNPQFHTKMTIKSTTAVSVYKRDQSAVEVLDVLMHYYTTLQHTNDWTLSLFFTLLNIAAVNAQVIWSSQNSAVIPRRLFIRDLGLSLLSGDLSLTLTSMSEPGGKKKSVVSTVLQNTYVKNRRRCRICYTTVKRDRRTRDTCLKCRQHICREHCVPGLESEKDEEDEYEEEKTPQQEKVPHMPEVSITVMRPTGETLHSRQGIQQIASKDCLICGRSYRYSHNARRHELTSHKFDRYVNKLQNNKKTPSFMQPKLRPNPFNPKARLMPNPISHKMQLLPKNMPRIMPQKIICPPKPIPIKTAKASQNNLPYPLRIKALKDLQIKKKEPQILKTLLTSLPEVLVSEPEIMNSGPESPETLISEPEIASFQVEAILSEPNDYEEFPEEERDKENHNHQSQNYDTVDMNSENEIEIARQRENTDEVDANNDDDENIHHEEEKVNEVDNEKSQSPQQTAAEESMDIEENYEPEDGDGNNDDDEEGNDEGETEERENHQSLHLENEGNDDEEDMPPIGLAPEIELNELQNNTYNSEANDDEEPDESAELNVTEGETAQEINPDKIFVTNAQREFIKRYRDVIEQVNTKRCICCDKGYPRRKAVIQHLQKNGHKVPKHTCYNCVVTFAGIGALLSHMRQNACTDLWKIIYDEKGITSDMIIEEPKSKIQAKDIFNAKSYACRLCPAKFQLKQSIMKHISEFHEDGQSAVPLGCVHCRATFKDKSVMKKHIRTGECTVYIHCDLCSEQFSSMQEFNDHALSAHAEHFVKTENQNKDGTVTDCYICGTKTNSYSNLLKHFKALHEVRPLHCQFCGVKFEQPVDLNKHIYGEHPDQHPEMQDEPDMSLVKEEAEEYHYSCTECNAIFETVDAWTDHQVAEHNQVAHHCDQCEKKFLRPSELAEHKNTHLRVKFYPCSICSNSYSTPQKLSDHVQNVHPGAGNSHNTETEFFCDICIRAFKSRQAYSNHMRIHAKVPTTNRKPGEPKGFDPRIIGKPIKQFTMSNVVPPGFINFKPNTANVPNAPYSCDICGKGFMHKKNIWKHKKVLHADIINDRNDSEENTMHASTEEDEYNVDENGALLSTPQFNSFNFTNFTNNVQQSQADTMPFCCELCPKQFPLRTSLWKHKRAKHGIVNMPGSSGEGQTPAASGEGQGGRSSCTICKITFADKKSYYRHRKNVHKSTTQMCKICGKPLNSTDELYQHLKAAHARELLGYNANQSTSKSQDVSQELDNEFANEQEAADPSVDYQARYPCDSCGKQFVGLLSLQNHQCINQSQSQPQTFDCEICHKSYTSIAALKSHRGWHLRSPDGKAAANNSGLWMPQHKVTSKISKHEVIEPPVVTRQNTTIASVAKRRLPPEVEVTVVNPNKKLRSDDSVDLDQQSEAVEGRYCTICDKEFTKRAAYQRHMDEVHQPNSVFCPVCDKSFTRKSTLLVHMKKHYEGGEGSSSTPQLDEDEGYSCDLCGAQYDTEDAVRAHKVRHHGEEEESAESEEDDGHVPIAQPGEFTCGQCGDGVATARDLITHRAMHNTPTKFFCNICKVYFVRALDLSSHTRARHADNEKVFFPCAMCDRFYMNKKSLQRHIDMAH